MDTKLIASILKSSLKTPLWIFPTLIIVTYLFALLLHLLGDVCLYLGILFILIGFFVLVKEKYYPKRKERK